MVYKMISKKTKVLALLAIVGIPTSLFGVYSKYLKFGVETSVSGAESIAAYNQCMQFRANLLPRRVEAGVFLSKMELELSRMESSAARLGSIAGASGSSPSLAIELPQCVSDLTEELARLDG